MYSAYRNNIDGLLSTCWILVSMKHHHTESKSTDCVGGSTHAVGVQCVYVRIVGKVLVCREGWAGLDAVKEVRVVAALAQLRRVRMDA